MEKEYVVTLKNAEDADQFYSEMTASSGDGVVPNRTVDVVNARPGSLRNTEYSLTEEEAAALKEDDRVLDVEIPVHLMENVSSGPALTQTGDFDKTTSSAGDNVNWGLIRCNNTTNNYGTGLTTSENYNYFLDGTGVDIVIKDSGIEANHPEWEDANGTSRLQQINWYTEAGVSGISQNSSFYTDADGHGTHVAGIAAGKNYGWAKGARIYAMKLEGTGAIAGSGVAYTAYDLIRLWHNNKPVDPATGYKRPTIVNSSWGYYSWWDDANQNLVTPANYGLNYRGVSYTGASIDTAAERLAKGWNGDVTGYFQPYRSTEVDAEVEDLINAGVIFVHAAGNFGFKIDLPGGPDYNNYSYNDPTYRRYNRGSSPTGKANANSGFGDSIEVGAIDRAAYSSSLDQRTVYSNTGPGVDIYAPGENIMSAWRNGSGSTYFWNSSYRQYNTGGTSMACPQVAGVAALVAQLNPHFTPAQMKDYIKTKCSTTGYIYDAGGNNNFSNNRALYGGGDLFLKNPFNEPTAYKITNSGSSGGTAPTVSGSTSISIIENTSTSTVLATYTASGTTPITWSVTGTDASNFNINSSGQLTFSVSPDYETPADRSQSINIVATNSAGSDSHAVSITVTNDTSDDGGGGGGITSFDMGYTAAGQNRTAPNSQRAWCLERDTSYGYTRYAWFKNANANTATRYYWNDESNPYNTWLAQANSTLTFTALGTNWLGLADNGTLLCGVDSVGNISIVNKSTGSQVASAYFNENLQGVLWDGTDFWAGSYTTPSRAIRIETGGLLNSSFTLPSPSPAAKTNNRSAFYDFNKNYYYFGDANAAHAYTFNGSSFTFVGQEASTEWTSQEGEYFEQSDGSKYLIAHNGTNLTSLTPV